VLRILSKTCADAGIQCPAEVNADIHSALAKLVALIDAGKLPVHIDATFPLDKAEALELNRAGHTRGKIVLQISQ
jgi:NADPH:quinone reductase-like Zn-dependent oxidoreductase